MDVCANLSPEALAYKVVLDQMFAKYVTSGTDWQKSKLSKISKLYRNVYFKVF